MTRRWALVTCGIAALSLGACENDDQRITGPQGQAALRNYVSMGTSVSAGVQSAGIVYFTQAVAWPAQVAFAARVPFRRPDIQTPGCRAPLAAPLQFGIRLGGRPITDTICSPNFVNVVLPTNNVAVDGATATEALNVTSDSLVRAAATVQAQANATTDAALKARLNASAASIRFRSRQLARILGPNRTQVSAMLEQRPSFVSVEYGANELLPGLSGIVIPGVTVTPFEAFRVSYDAIIDSVKSTGAKVLIVGLIENVSSFPALRRGSEIHAESLAFNAFFVTISENCRTTAANNLITVPEVVPGFLSAGRAAAGAGQPRPVLSCADRGTGVRDGIISEAEQAVVNGLITQYNAYLQQKATENEFAYYSLGVLYNTAKDGLPFNLQNFLTSASPYGPLISLDGVHPGTQGARVLADAAVRAINTTYGFEIPPPIATPPVFARR